MSDHLVALYIAGLAGSAGMDLISPLASRMGFRTGVTMPLIGRWFIGLCSGRLRHYEIRNTPAQRHENLIGWLFHYLIGGGSVALLFLPWLWLSGASQLPGTITPYILFGLLTSLLPWLVLMPSYGWGLFGRHGPQGTRPLIASPLNHLGYGIGIWLAVLTEKHFGLIG